MLDRQAKHMPLAPFFKAPLAALLSIPRRWPFTTSMEDIWKWSPLGKLFQLRLGVFDKKTNTSADGLRKCSGSNPQSTAGFGSIWPNTYFLRKVSRLGSRLPLQLRSGVPPEESEEGPQRQPGLCRGERGANRARGLAED